MSKITVKFITLGCKTNLYESDAMAEIFRKSGYTVTEGKNADVCVINTCTVTAEGARKSRQQIRRMRRDNPGAVVVVTGCLAQTEAETILAETGADVLIGNGSRSRVAELAERALKGVKVCEVGDISKERSFEELGGAHGQSRVRANLKIEDGCNNFCSYCKIPYARGPVRSRSMDRIKAEAEALAKEDYPEIVLTGIHIGSYGRDLKDGTGLIDVMETVSRAAEGAKIRLGSLEPVMVDEEFVSRAAALKNLCPQFHLSLQSGCDRTLSAMKRRYTAEDFRAAVGRLRETFADGAITTDLIVGFPGETAEDFEESRRFCEEIGFSQMHIFPYSVREGTAAAKLPNRVPEEEKNRRAHVMLNLAAEMKQKFYEKYIGREMPVLFEQRRSGMWCGTTDNYMEVRLADDGDLKGKRVSVKISAYDTDGGFAIGE